MFCFCRITHICQAETEVTQASCPAYGIGFWGLQTDARRTASSRRSQLGEALAKVCDKIMALAWASAILGISAAAMRVLNTGSVPALGTYRARVTREI